MYAMPIPSVPKAFDVVRLAVGLTADATPLRIGAILFEADVLHADAYGRQVYGERWDLSWSGPKGSILMDLLAKDRTVLGMLDRRIMACMTRDATGPSDVLSRIDDMQDLVLLGTVPSNSLPESDVEAVQQAVRNVPVGQEEIVAFLLRHPAVLRSDGVLVRPEDMLDPGHEQHEARLRRIREGMAYEAY